MLHRCRQVLYTSHLIRRASSADDGKNFDFTKTLNLMSLEKKHQIDARLAYENRKENFVKFQSGNKNVQIEILGSGAHGAPRCVHLCTDTFRYLFNCGEGTQRLANEYRVKLSKAPNVFITYPSWENLSGLLGLSLSLQNVGIPELNVYGPKLIENLFSATNKFIALRTISIKVLDCIKRLEFNDGVLNIKSVPIYPMHGRNVNEKHSDSRLITPGTSNNQINSDFDNDFDDIDYYEHLRKIQHDKKPHVKKKKQRSRSLECSNNKEFESEKIAIAYICRSKETLGTLLFDKCVEYGVPNGPLLGKLKNGENITLNNGTVVKSLDVKTPDIPGAVIIIVECPNEDFLDSLLEEPAFYRHQSGDPDDIAEMVVHFTNSKILNNSKYQDWINRFPKQTKHLFINESNDCLGSVGVHRLQCKLNVLHPEIFPLLPDCGIPQFPRRDNSGLSEAHLLVKKCDQSIAQEIDRDEMYFKCGNHPFIKGQTLCKVYIRPVYEYDYSISLILKNDMFLQEVFSIPGFKEELEKLKHELQGMELSKKHYPKILFLGTGSSQPNKLRNTSGILVFLEEKNYMLLDCGEGTYGQLITFFGKEKTREIISNLNVIYVSHLHADHHIGLITLLKQRKLAIEEKLASSNNESDSKPFDFQPVQVLAPVQLTRWLNLFSKEFENISTLYKLIPNAYLVDHLYLKDNYKKCLKSLNLKEIKTTLVDHCPNAFGVALTHNDGWKLTYSGDTKPCPNLVKLGMNSDILIHEATLDDSLEKIAEIKLHSTTSQAIKIGREMNAKFILLTHFSQRYSHIPILNENFTEEVGIAFDNMLVSLNQLPILSKLIPILKLMFSEYQEEMEEKRLKAIRSRKRKSSLKDEIPIKQRI